jgi:Capsule assembly protein Wzi
MRPPSPFGNRHSARARGWWRPALLVIGTACSLACGAAAWCTEVPDPGNNAPGASTAEFLPTDHVAWRDVAFLSRMGGLRTLPLATRPLPRVEVARALATLLREQPRLADTAPARRLARELAPELSLLAGTHLSTPPRETPPPLEWTGEGVRFRAQAEFRASATVTGSEGEIPPGTRGILGTRLYLRDRVFVYSDLGVEKILDANPLGDSIVKNSPWYLSTNAAHVAIRTDAVELAFGQLENRWGAGESGTLLMSDGALAVPGIFAGRTFGGRVRAVAMTGALHYPEGRWVSGHRVEVRVADGLRIGASEVAVYPSSGLDPLYVVGVIPYTIVQRLHDRSAADPGSTGNHRNNLLIGADAVWQPGGGWQLDGELLVDDLATESAAQPDRLGYLAGVAWSGFALGSTCNARAEFAKVYRYTYAVFYGANLIQDDVPLGYAAGPDVEHARVHLDRDFGTDVQLGCGWEWTRKGEGAAGEFWDPATGGTRHDASHLSGTVERRSFPHLRACVDWRDVVSVQALGGVLSVSNLGHVPGDNPTSAHFRFDASVQW